MSQLPNITGSKTARRRILSAQLRSCLGARRGPDLVCAVEKTQLVLGVLETAAQVMFQGAPSLQEVGG